MSKGELKIKMIESYLKLHHELNGLRNRYLIEKDTMSKETRKTFDEEVENIKFNIRTREKVLPEMTS